MKVTLLPDVAPRPRRVAVGTFDGVHLGHRKVIAGSDTVLTFDPHPSVVVAPGREPKLLTTLERKAELVGEIGARELVVVPFDAAFAKRSAEQFVDDVLLGALGATHVSAGENFRFGHDAEGDAAQLVADDRFEAHVVPLLEVDGEVVSSSHIRGLLLGGAVEYANHLLGDPFTIDGPVVHGDERGRTLGFPTANLVPRKGYATPGHGVYACRARTPDGTWHSAAVNIGVRPMFQSGRGELIEAFILDYEGDLYDHTLRIEVLERLRGERRFESVAALVEQMEQDVVRTRAITAGLLA